MTINMPDFFIVGAPKCGTTALYYYLSNHPSVFMPEEKEPNFFCSDIEWMAKKRDFQSYLALFDSAPIGALTGEASVWYLYSQNAIRTILSFRPDAKIIVIMRNPVETARALHAQLLFNLMEDIDEFEDAWNAQSERAKGKMVPWNCSPQALQYGAICSFAEQIRRVVEVVPEKQRLFLVYEEFFSDPLRYYKQLLDFLGLPSDGRMEFPVVNAAGTARRKWLQRLFRQPPFPVNRLRKPLQRISQVLGLHLGALALSLTKPGPHEKERLRPEFERELYEHFGPDIQVLEGILGRRLDVWRSIAC